MKMHLCNFWFVEYRGGGTPVRLPNCLQTLMGKWISTTRRKSVECRTETRRTLAKPGSKVPHSSVESQGTNKPKQLKIELAFEIMKILGPKTFMTAMSMT
jgi:hypothetical protein